MPIIIAEKKNENGLEKKQIRTSGIDEIVLSVVLYYEAYIG